MNKWSNNLAVKTLRWLVRTSRGNAVGRAGRVYQLDQEETSLKLY